MDIGSSPSSGPMNVEERLQNLERQNEFYKIRFQETEKKLKKFNELLIFKENVSDWIFQNFGVHIRSSSSNNNPETPSTTGSSGSLKFTIPISHLSSTNGWSPESSDSLSNSKVTGKRRGRRKKHEIDYKETEDAEELSNVPVPKRKRGRPKKNQTVSVITCATENNALLNQSMIPDIKQEISESSPWDSTGENAGNTPIPSIIPQKRGRGRPKKVKPEHDEYAFEDGESLKKKHRRKKREPGMPISKICDDCNLEFESHQELVSHKRIVHPEKFYKCNVCHEMFLHPGFLARHMEETHTLEKEYKCHLPAINQMSQGIDDGRNKNYRCISSFSTYQLLKAHCLEKHGVDLGRQTDWKRDTELAMTVKNHDYGQTNQHNDPSYLGSVIQAASSQQSQSMAQSQSCSGGPSVNEIVRNDMVDMVVNNNNTNNNLSHIQQQQNQHQQSSNQHQNRQQNANQQHPLHSLSQHSLLHQQHSQQQQQEPYQSVIWGITNQHHLMDDEDDDDLTALFNDGPGNDAMGSYLNTIEPDPMQMY